MQYEAYLVPKIKNEIKAEILKELSDIFMNTETSGDYLGRDDIWQDDLEGTLVGIGAKLGRRAREISEELENESK